MEKCINYLVDINECDLDNGGCNQTCSNIPASFLCGCNPGFQLDGDRTTCNGIHCDVTWERFPHYQPLVRGIRRSPVDSPHKGQ